jgi:1L-myo-inositol 1-phosphate cytidylyltransferase
MSSSVKDAIILAAGNGDRFRNGTRHSKLTTPIAGTPLLIRTLTAARQAGIRDAHLVLGYDAERVRALASTQLPHGLILHCHVNPEWHQENGLSVLAARVGVADRPFAILMGDHIFEPPALEALRRVTRGPGEALLGVDRATNDPGIVAEATKVRMHGERVTAIGKTVDPFDALDTGLFVCDAALFTALAESCAAGDTTLSGGVARLAADGMVRGIDIGRARWCDVDTLADLTMAEELTQLVPAT